MAEIMALGTSMIVVAAGVAAGGLALEGILLILKRAVRVPSPAGY
jgi:hypothetical protein